MFDTIKRWLRSINNPAIPLTAANITDYLGSPRSRSGIEVGAVTAMSYSPVWQGVQLISGDVAKLPLHVYQRMANGGKRRADDHPAYSLLRWSVGDLTSNLWLQAMVGQACLYGNAYSEIIRSPNGRVTELRFVPADRVMVKQVGESGIPRNVYEIKRNPTLHEWQTIPARNLFHLRGVTIDDLGGLSLIKYARDTIGRYLSSERFGDEFFNNAAVPQGFFTHPGQMSEAAQKNFLASLRRAHTGDGNRWKPMIIEESMTWAPAGVHPRDAMLVEMLGLGPKDVARFLNLPPHKLGDDTRTSYNSVEQENRSYIDSCLSQWITRLEREATDKLCTLAREVIGEYFAEFELNALLRASLVDRATAYRTLIELGILTRNEARVRENLNPLPGLDEPLTPGNMNRPGDQDGSENSLPQDDEEEENQREAAAAVLAEAMVRMVGRLVHSARNAARKPQQFLGFLNDLDMQHADIIEQALTPAAKLLRHDPAELTGELIEHCRDEFLTASDCQPPQLPRSIIDTRPALDAWATTYATELARWTITDVTTPSASSCGTTQTAPALPGSPPDFTTARMQPNSSCLA